VVVVQGAVVDVVVDEEVDVVAVGLGVVVPGRATGEVVWGLVGKTATVVVVVLGVEVVVVLRDAGFVVVVVEAVEVDVGVVVVLVGGALVVVGGALMPVVDVLVAEELLVVDEVLVVVGPLPPVTVMTTLSMLMWPSSTPPNSSNLMALEVPEKEVRS
jgi:hypothetical protein